MTPQYADPLADELALEWGEDTIYCEATCGPEDVLYEGSDDDDYDSSASRKMRYEAAGQRFLDGRTPFILTAVLKGPFESNWVNPWRSKQRTAVPAVNIRTSPGKLARSAKVKRNLSVPETIHPPHDSLECHLPSPESLNQTSETETHPYLEEDELVKVQQWRDTVNSEGRQKDDFWMSTTQTSVSERKRKANGSSWLKLLANKRQRTDIMESGSVDTPVRPRPQLPTSTTNAMNTSFTSAPDHLPSSATAAARFFFNQEDPSVSEDELSSDKVALDQASVESSSPLSHLQYTPVLDPEVNFLSQGTPEQHTPSKAPVSQQRSIAGHPAVEPQNTMLKHTATGPAFETQEDESFCFKRRPRLDQVAKPTSDEDVSMVEDDVATRSELSLPAQYMDSIASISDLKDSTVAERVVDPQCSNSLVEAGTTNPLPFISSERANRSELPKEPTHNATGIVSKSSSVTKSAASDSELSNGSHQNSMKFPLETIAPKLRDGPERQGETQDVDMQEVSEHDNNRAVIEHLEASDTESGDESNEEDEDDDENIRAAKEDTPVIKSPPATSNKTPQISTVRQKTETTPSQASPLGHDRGDSTSATAGPPQQTSPSRRDILASGPASSPINTQENKAGAGSTRSTPREANTRRASGSSQPWNHDASPTIVNTPVHEQHPEKQPVQSVSTERAPVPLSQQSPWVAHKLSQYATLSTSLLPTKDTGLEHTKTDVPVVGSASSVERKPWIDEAADLPENSLQITPIIKKKEQEMFRQSVAPVVETEAHAQAQEEFVAATPTIASTPEPRFSVKSFASFRSPSPERNSRHGMRAVWRKLGSGLPSTQAILASATKNPWESKSSGRGVSFAPLPNWRHPESSMPTTPCPSLSKRQGSPPPETPTAELPTSEGDKFQKHFNAVSRGPIIRRSHHLLPSESQRTVGSPLPDAMADAFIAADQMRQPTAPTDPAKSDRETEESQDPFDMVADIMLEEFDCDGDMNITTQSPIMAQGQQSPW